MADQGFAVDDFVPITGALQDDRQLPGERLRLRRRRRSRILQANQQLVATVMRVSLP
jgi:hypothetical protein